MNADPEKAAQARIEAALARIEAASAGLRRNSGGEELASLKKRHARLRDAVQDSLGQLDLLIEGAQG